MRSVFDGFSQCVKSAFSRFVPPFSLGNLLATGAIIHPRIPTETSQTLLFRGTAVAGVKPSNRTNMPWPRHKG